MQYFTFPFIGTKPSKPGVHFLCTAQPQCAQDTFPEVISHMWPWTTVLNSTDLENYDTNSFRMIY